MAKFIIVEERINRSKKSSVACFARRECSRRDSWVRLVERLSKNWTEEISVVAEGIVSSSLRAGVP